MGVGTNIAKTCLASGVLLSLFGLVGCSAPLAAQAPRFHRVLSDHDAADASRLILPADIVLTDPVTALGTEYARRDRALAVGTLDGDLAVPAFYEGEVPPNLWETRRLYLDQDPRRVLYFQSGYNHSEYSQSGYLNRRVSHRSWY